MNDTPDIARTLLDAIAEPALLVANGRTVALNAAAGTLLGDSSVGSDVRLAIRHPEALEAILSGRDADLDIVGIGGPQRPWSLSLRAAGRGQVLVRLIDRAPARAAERMRVDFVANASHELRTPLATVIGYAETLAEPGALPDSLRQKFGETIETEARRMLRIVEDLMSLSRIEADRFVAPADLVRLGEVARIAADNSHALAERRGCTVRVAIASDVQVRGDFAQLLQVVDNLVGNALRYGCSADAAEVAISLAGVHGRALLTVTDQGDGISPEHLPRLTERFYRINSARSRDSGGTGLGLAIVKHIVERHRGTLEIRSGPGKGTQVRVDLPAVTKL